MRTTELYQAALTDRYELLPSFPDEIKTPEFYKEILQKGNLNANIVYHIPDEFKTPEFCKEILNIQNINPDIIYGFPNGNALKIIVDICYYSVIY